jgi:hypothetical protein
MYWAARAFGKSIGILWWEQESEFENKIVACRLELGDAAFEEAAEKGRHMTMEQAIAYALEDQE